MPKKLFFSLTEEKKQIIIDSAKIEFSENKFENVSINKIIKNANISRGSFYTYFEDKQDLLLYIMEEYANTFEDVIEKSIKDNNGNIFNIVIDAFEYICRYISNSDNVKLCKNIFGNLQIKDNIVFKRHDKKGKEYFEYILNNINVDNLNVKSKSEAREVFKILFNVLKEAIVELTWFEEDINDVRDGFLLQIRLLKNGIEKKESNNENKELCKR